MANIHDVNVRDIDGREVSLLDYAGKALLVVNVASKCGLTPQYAGLEALQRRYADRGFAVLGFPCNQFMGQEPGSESEIKDFCQSTYDVTFPLFSKLEVNGDNRHPLYATLTTAQVGPAESGDIQWNFEKFVVSPKGEVLARFAPPTEPDDQALVDKVEEALPQG